MNRQQTNRREKKGRILRAARAAFGVQGFQGATLQGIARRAGLPKPNIVYYFGSKERLYEAVLHDIIHDWNDAFDHLQPDADPAMALDRVVRAKFERVINDPRSSRIFAMEILNGAPYTQRHLREAIRPWLADKSAVISGWVDDGRIAAIDPIQLIFMIWAVTQHYADFGAQVLVLMDRSAFTETDLAHIADALSAFVLRSCGLEPLTHADHALPGLAAFGPAGEDALEQNDRVVDQDAHHGQRD
ncbi:TetR family transcriptional regulator C-terminal domain-containing protein [Spiribacter pallidus]|uniref:TetR family transcriptional regulator C-terminal domain-containing protein n=1 Tax=Spiribacter pallidus TaxID=1987936 RepID=A0ABV3TDZ8_9GAMM